MATSKDFIAYLEDHLAHVPRIRFKAMFGEYALYCNERVVALVCDQTLFVKITEGTRRLLEGRVETRPPYPRAKDAYVLTDAELHDEALVKQIITVCHDDLAANAGGAKAATKKPAAKTASTKKTVTTKVATKKAATKKAPT